MTHTFLAFIDDMGHFAWKDQKSFQAAKDKLRGHEVVLTMKRKPTRQGSQSMRYYRGVVVPDIARACGYSDPDDFQGVHESLAWKFLRLPDHPELGYPRRRRTSKDDLSQQEMTDYISQVIEWAESSIPECRVRRPDEFDASEIFDPGWDDEMSA